MAENNFCKTSYIPKATEDFDTDRTNKNLLSNSVFAGQFEDVLANFEKVISTQLTDSPNNTSSTVTTTNNNNSNTTNSNASGNIIPEVFKDVAIELNNVITENRDYIVNNYPNIKTRIEMTPFITPVEIQTFTTDYYYDPIIFSSIITRPITTNDTTSLFTKMDYFFSPNNVSTRTMGSFCALVPSVFAGIKEFSNFFNNINVLAGSIDNFLGRLSDLSSFSLMETLKKQLESVIDDIAKEIKAKMERFGFSFVDGNLVYSNQRIMNKIDEMRTKITSFFSDENIQHIKDQINSLIAYSLSLFENPSIEEIQYLIYRFCALIGQVETIMTGMTAPLDDTVRAYTSTKGVLSAKSSIYSAQAQSAGALRFAPPTIGNSSYEMRAAATARVRESGRYTPLISSDYEGIVPWNDGNGVAGKVIFPNKLGGMGREGWETTTGQVKAYFCRGQIIFGRELRVNSAYRSKAYNSSITGAAKASMHLSGEAIDSSFDGIQSSSLRSEYLEIMYNAGFEWFNWYPSQNFIHIDIKRRGSDNDLIRRFGARKDINNTGLITPDTTEI